MTSYRMVQGYRGHPPKPVGMRVLYLGDFDLSGDLIETNTRRDVHCEPAPDSATASANACMSQSGRGCRISLICSSGSVIAVNSQTMKW